MERGREERGLGAGREIKFRGVGGGRTESLSAAEFFLRPSRFAITAREICEHEGSVSDGCMRHETAARDICMRDTCRWFKVHGLGADLGGILSGGLPQLDAVVLLVPLAVGGGVDLDNGVLHERLGAHQLVVRAVVEHLHSW